MANPEELDIWMQVNGDPMLGPDGDFLMALSSDAILQSVMFRLKTVAGDCFIEPGCGASLEYFVGSPVNIHTQNQIENNILYALTHDGYLAESDLNLVVIPLDMHTFGVVLQINVGSQSSVLSFSIDLMEGKLSFPTN